MPVPGRRRPPLSHAGRVALERQVAEADVLQEREPRPQLAQDAGADQLFARLEQIGRAVPLMAAALATSIAGIRQVIVVGDEAQRVLGDRSSCLRS